ncbi:hypothetical protein P280DRAFT_369272, partial [Massarina eburnea CBS 473.64]
ALLPLAAAHFILDWPTNRGFDDSKAVDFPCGGFNDVKTRTEFPLNGGPIQLDMHHTQTQVAVYLAVGNNPGSNYNIVLRPQLTQEGLGDFCLGQINIPSGLNISAGTNATIQVVSNGDPSGGLYQCADVTFVNTTLSQSDYNDHCKNNTGVKVTSENQEGNPNGTSSGTATSSGASSTPSNAAAHATAASWLLGAAGVAGLAFL